MLWLLGLMNLVLSLGDINALIPLIIILILITAAGGLSRGFDIFSLFGLGTLAGIGLGSKGSMAKRTAYDKKQPEEFKGAFVSTPNNEKNQTIRNRKDLSGWEKFKAMGSVGGGKYGNIPVSPSFISGAYHTYRALSGKNKASFSAPRPGKGPVVLSKNAGSAGPAVIGSALGASPVILSKSMGKTTGGMTVKQVNDAVFNRVRMAVMEPKSARPRKVPEKPIPFDQRKGENNVVPFSSIENATAWVMAGSVGAKLTTSRMKKLAVQDPKAFRRKYNKIVRMDLHRDILNNKAREVGSSFRMSANDNVRSKLGYAGPIYKEWKEGYKRQVRGAMRKPTNIEVTMHQNKMAPTTHMWEYDSEEKKWTHYKQKLGRDRLVYDRKARKWKPVE